MCFGCSKEPSHWDISFEYPQHMFWVRNEENCFQYTLLSGGLKICKNRQHFKSTNLSWLSHQLPGTFPGRSRYIPGWRRHQGDILLSVQFSHTPVWQEKKRYKKTFSLQIYINFVISQSKHMLCENISELFFSSPHDPKSEGTSQKSTNKSN